MQIINALEYLEHSASLYPDKTAFADSTKSYSFSELHSSSRSIGTELIEMGVGVRERIAVLVDRTAVTLAGFFGALGAGCAYVPIDNRMPADRMEDILSEIKPAAILYSEKDTKLAEKLSSFAPTVCTEKSEKTEENAALLTERREKVLDIDPAYMIFTSGSTGKPKGILISHRSLIDFTEWMADYCKITSENAMGNQAPFYFDLSVKDIYQTLRNGCTTYILPKKDFMFPMLLVDDILSHGVNTLIWATSAFRLAADSGVFEKKIPETVSKIILGGEALQARHVNIWKKAIPDVQIINLYGPTEVTVDCTAFPLTRDYADGETIPIGKACRNMEIMLLDDDMKPVPDGEPGEICVRGAGLALGYFADKEKTDAAFVQNPMNPYYPDRIYRTGDIGRLDGDGNIVYLCRRDGQIKHMGYRIELGEIETAVGAVENVDSAVCFFDKENDFIVCCVEIGSNDTDAAYLTTAVKNRLPKYMLPNVWRVYKRMPSNANGKIDRVKLKQEYEDEKNN